MKKIIYVVTILALLLQPGISFFPGASAQEGGGELLAPTYPIHYVKPVATGTGNCSSWENACGLKPALSAAAPGDEVWVQQGTYKPDFWENLTDFTFVAWIYWGGGAYWQHIFDLGKDSNNFMSLVTWDSSGRMRFDSVLNGDHQSFNTPGPLPPGSWQHVAFTLSGDTATIYLNGQFSASGTITHEIKDVAGENVWLGRSQFPTDPYTFAHIDEVALFNRALSEAEIDGIIASGWNATPGKVLALHLEEANMYDGFYLHDDVEQGYGGVLRTNDGNNHSSGPWGTGRALYLDGSGDYVALQTSRHGAFRLKSGVAIYGGFLGTETTREARDWENNITILSGDVGVEGNSNDNSYNVVKSYALDASAVLDGFTIEEGRADGMDPGGTQSWESGGGMYISGGNPTLSNLTFSGNTAIEGGGIYSSCAHPTLANVTFSGNTATDNGGGIFNHAIDCSGTDFPVLTDVTFSGNTAGDDGGGMYNLYSEPSLTGVIFSDNLANTGGGIWNAFSSPELLDVTFSRNQAGTGAGMYNRDQSNPSLVDVSFDANIASDSGGGMFNYGQSNPSLVNVILSGNYANTIVGRGGGMTNLDQSNPSLVGVTFSGNHAWSGAGIYNENSSPTLVQTSFYTNTAEANGGGMYSHCIGSTSFPDIKLANVLFHANHASGANGQGGGFYFDTENCTANLVNVTISNNDAHDVGGGIYISGEQGEQALALRNSLLWGNTGASTDTEDDQIYATQQGIFARYNTTVQANATDPSPFLDADGVDNILGTADDNLRPKTSSAGVIDGGDERDLPLDIFDLDGDLNTAELLPVDLDGGPRVYADFNMDEQPDNGDDGYPSRVDRGAYEAGCYGWHMQGGMDDLGLGQAYREGFHIDPTATISATLQAFDDLVSESDLGPLQDAREHYGVAITCSAHLPAYQQVAGRASALTGLLDADWEAATGSVLFGNEYVVKALDVRSTNPPNALDEEINQLRTSLLWYGWATRVYTETLSTPLYDEVMALQPGRVNPLTGDPKSYLDVERLALAAARSSRASLELAERQFRKFTPQSKSDAARTLRAAYSRAAADLALLESLWEDVVDEPSYAELVQNMGDMRRLLGFIQYGRNPFAYAPDYVPFYYDPEKTGNNYQQTYNIAHDYLIDEVVPQVENAQDISRQIDDDYAILQERLNDAEDRYNSHLVALCGSKVGQPLEPDLEGCGSTSGGFKEQLTAIQGAGLRVDLALEKMDNQLRLIAIEQERARKVVNAHSATAVLITQTGQELARLATEEIKLEREQSTAGGIMGIIGGIFSGAGGGKDLNPAKGTPWGSIAGGIIGGVTAAINWKNQNDLAGSLEDIAEQRELLKAKQAARVEYEEIEIVDANSEALVKQYYLRHAEARIEYTISLNNLMQELDRLASLKTELEYLLAERDKTLDLIGDQAQYRDPATRVERDLFMEIAYNMFEQAGEYAFLAGQALEYQMNEEPGFTPPPIASLDDLYRIRDTDSLDAALAQMDTRWTNWAGTHPIPQDRDHKVKLSQALGFEDAYDADLGRVVTAEEKFNAFVRDPANRDAHGNLQFTFQTSIFRGNRFFPTNYYNDRIVSIRMCLYGQDLGVDDKVIIRLVQSGTSFIRTANATISGPDDIREYNLERKLGNVAAAVNTCPAPLDAANTEFANRSVAFTDWTLTIDKISEPDNFDLNISGIEEIELVVTHRGYSLQTQQFIHPDFSQPPASRAYQPIPAENRGDYAGVSLSTQDAIFRLSSLTATSVISDFIGTVAITIPTYMPSFDLNIVLTDTSGVLSGYIDAADILGFPLDASGRGPVVSGTWQGNHLVLQTAPFTSSDPNLTRQVFLDGVAVGGQLSAEYRELIWGLTPDNQPLEIVGEFILIRAPEPMIFLPLVRK